MSDELELKSVLKLMFSEMNIDKRFLETQVYGIWENVVGRSIARRTLNLRVQNGILYVNVDSAVLRNELLYAKIRLIRLLNSKLSSEIINDIIFH